MASVDNLVSNPGEVPERGVKTTGGEELVRSLISDTNRESIHGTAKGNVKVLALTAFLFGLITAVQWYFGGVVTHSNALLADCYCMLVDALSYFLNMWAELAPPRSRAPLRLTVPLISLTVLAVLTGMTIRDAIDVFAGKNEDDGVNPWIVWTFGFVGLLFDLVSIYAFWRNKQRGALPVNMLAAFMHVGADFVRSTSTTIEGTLLFIFTSWDGDTIDAVNTVVIVTIIYICIIYGLYEVVMDWKKYLAKKEAPKAVEDASQAATA